MIRHGAIHRPKADIAMAREAYGSALAAWMRLTSRTPTELAKLIRVSSSATVSRWTTGVASPRQEHREALAALGFEGPMLLAKLAQPSTRDTEALREDVGYVRQALEDAPQPVVLTPAVCDALGDVTDRCCECKTRPVAEDGGKKCETCRGRNLDSHAKSRGLPARPVDVPLDAIRCQGGCGAFLARDRGSRFCPKCWRAGKATCWRRNSLGVPRSER